MRAHLGTIVYKFGGDRVMFVVEVAICAKFTDRQTDGRTDGQTDRRTTDRQTDGRRTPRDCISSFQWNELKIGCVNDCSAQLDILSTTTILFSSENLNILVLSSRQEE